MRALGLTILVAGAAIIYVAASNFSLLHHKLYYCAVAADKMLMNTVAVGLVCWLREVIEKFTGRKAEHWIIVLMISLKFIRNLAILNFVDELAGKPETYEPWEYLIAIFLLIEWCVSVYRTVKNRNK